MAGKKVSDTKALWKAKEKKDAKDRKEDARKAAENLHLLDKDGDGDLTVEEVAEGLGVSEKEAAKILKKGQAHWEKHGGKGSLNKFKATSLASTHKQEVKPDAEEAERFRELDKDGDGLVTIQEIRAGLGVSEEEAAKMLKTHGGKAAVAAGKAATKKNRGPPVGSPAWLRQQQQQPKQQQQEEEGEHKQGQVVAEESAIASPQPESGPAVALEPAP